MLHQTPDRAGLAVPDTVCLQRQHRPQHIESGHRLTPPHRIPKSQRLQLAKVMRIGCLHLWVRQRHHHRGLAGQCAAINRCGLVQRSGQAMAQVVQRGAVGRRQVLLQLRRQRTGAQHGQVFVGPGQGRLQALPPLLGGPQQIGGQGGQMALVGWPRLVADAAQAADGLHVRVGPGGPEQGPVQRPRAHQLCQCAQERVRHTADQGHQRQQVLQGGGLPARAATVAPNAAAPGQAGQLAGQGGHGLRRQRQQARQPRAAMQHEAQPGAEAVGPFSIAPGLAQIADKQQPAAVERAPGLGWLRSHRARKRAIPKPGGAGQARVGRHHPHLHRTPADQSPKAQRQGVHVGHQGCQAGGIAVQRQHQVGRPAGLPAPGQGHQGPATGQLACGRMPVHRVMLRSGRRGVEQVAQGFAHARPARAGAVRHELPGRLRCLVGVGPSGPLQVGQYRLGLRLGVRPWRTVHRHHRPHFGHPQAVRVWGLGLRAALCHSKRWRRGRRRRLPSQLVARPPLRPGRCDVGQRKPIHRPLLQGLQQIGTADRRAPPVCRRGALSHLGAGR